MLRLRNEGTARRAEARSSVVHFQSHLPVPPTFETGQVGIPAHLTQPALQPDVFKELVNQRAWAVGSTYRQSYTQRRSNVRTLAADMARDLIDAVGYPLSISK